MSQLKPLIVDREYQASHALALWREGVNPILARVLANRGVSALAQVSGPFTGLAHYSLMKDAVAAANYLVDSIMANKNMLVIADYDCDGATACTVAVRGLRAFGANINYLVPDRKIHGYGLTPSIVDEAIQQSPRPDILITVDNGIASHAGVSRANELGLEVVVTDHHLPSKDKPVPSAKFLLDPAQADCAFPSKTLAGCGVIWYLLWAMQDVMRARGLPITAGFKVSDLLPFVAVGSVADLVRLDQNNRILVDAGIKKIRDGSLGTEAIAALATIGAGNPCKVEALTTSDISFGIGPRINSAGRLTSMKVGIDCLLSSDPDEIARLALELSSLNTERKEIEYDIAIEAYQSALIRLGPASAKLAIVVHDAGWHVGVIGIVAGRLKERFYRPTFVLATDDVSGDVKGSGRSIPGVNLKDMLDLLDKENPGVLAKFGGHSMAAGVTLCPGKLLEFQVAFEGLASRLIPEDVLQNKILVDGCLEPEELTVETVYNLRGLPWGQGFPEPTFQNVVSIVEAKLAGAHKDQLNMVVNLGGLEFAAVKYRHSDGIPIPGTSVQLVYKLGLATSRKGVESVKLMVDQLTCL